MSRFIGIRSLADQILLLGTEGNDHLHAVDYQRIIYGYDGDDHLIADNGNSFLYGGADDDLLGSGPGADLLDGGEDEDTVSYSSSDAGVFVSLFTGQTGGGYAEGDTLVEIENVTGSSHNDLLIGDNANNVLNGARGGSDQIHGLGGNDTIISGRNNPGEAGDFLSGGSGDDAFVFFFENDSGGGVAMDRIADFTIGEDQIVFRSSEPQHSVQFSGEATGYSVAASETWYQHTTNGADNVTILHTQLVNQDSSVSYVDIMLDGHLNLTATDLQYQFDLD